MQIRSVLLEPACSVTNHFRSNRVTSMVRCIPKWTAVDMFQTCSLQYCLPHYWRCSLTAVINQFLRENKQYKPCTADKHKFHSDYGLLGCDIMLQSGRQTLMFQRNVLPPYSRFQCSYPGDNINHCKNLKSCINSCSDLLFSQVGQADGVNQWHQLWNQHLRILINSYRKHSEDI